jgi:hypothetical protein
MVDQITLGINNFINLICGLVLKDKTLININKSMHLGVRLLLAVLVLSYYIQRTQF